MPFVLDNSAVSGWFLENQATPYADAVAQRMAALAAGVGWLAAD